MSAYWPEFLKLALAHLLAVISPGPDFAMVLRQSLHHGRRAAVLTAIGIGSGICLHVGYSLLGIGLLVKSSPVAFNVLKFAGAAYLSWIGIHSLRSSRVPRGAASTGSSAGAYAQATPPAGRATAGSAWTKGFMTNALNPKATLFFVAVFATLISPRTPRLIQVGYGAWISLTTMAWFSFVAFVFAREKVRRSFLLHRHWIDRALGVIFLAFALSLVLTSIRP